MKNTFCRLAIFVFALLSSMAQAEVAPWDQWSQDDKADLLYDLDFASSESIPAGFQIVDLIGKKMGGEFSLDKISDAGHRDFAARVLKMFDRRVDREAIEQSPYEAYGDEEVIEFIILLDASGKIVGGIISKYQDGRDEDGNEGDINWQAHLRFDENAEPFADENGTEYDEMYFSWSGH